MNNKIDDLSLLLHQNPFDIICLCEHWLKDSEIKSVNLYNYNLASHFSRNVHIHGGVCIFLDKNVRYKIIDVSQFCTEFHIELCAIELTNIKTALITCYRSCSHGNFDIFINSLTNMLNHLYSKYNKIILTGDFNINILEESMCTKILMNTLKSFGLSFTIKEPTRVTSHSATCIDNIATNIDSANVCADVVDYCISDHFGVVLKIVCNLTAMKNKSHKQRFFSTNSLLHFKNSLFKTCFNDYFNCQNNPNFLAEFLTNIYVTLIDKHFPLKICHKRYNNPLNFFNDNLKQMRKTLSSLKIIKDCSKNLSATKIFTEFQRKYRHEISKAKQAACDSFILTSRNIPRDSWKLINSELNRNRKNSLHSTLDSNSFNNFFVNVAENIIKTLPYNRRNDINFLNEVRSPQDSFYLFPVCSNEVSSAIFELKSSACLDIYDINSKVMKESVDFIIDPLVHLINSCFANGEFPEILKVSKVLPIYKKGDLDCPNNFRPISIIPLFGKIIEIIVKHRLTAFLDKHSILHNHQFGFRKKCSTITAIQKLVRDITTSFENGTSVSLTLCDLSKAFDCVSHQLLLHKLHHYGIRGTALDFFKSYLCNRQQAVAHNHELSSLKKVEHGVPQGSVLGPLLFTIYINDIFCHLSPVECICYADDTSFYVEHKNLRELDEISIHVKGKVETWFSYNFLKLNSEKTQHMIFSTTNRSSINEVKLLGIMLDEGLKWYNHVDYLCNKLSSQLYLLRRLRNITSMLVLRTAYYGLVHSNISYGITLWGNSSQSIRVFKLQKQAIRIITKAGYRDSCRPLFKQLKILPLPCLYLLSRILDIHNNLNHYKKLSDIHGYPTRNSSNLLTQKFRLAVSVSNSPDLNIYNRIPANLRNLNAVQLKKNIKQFLLENCFYNIEEYMNTPWTT